MTHETEAYSGKHAPVKYGDVIVANKHLQLKLDHESDMMEEQMKADMRNYQKERASLRSKLTSHLHNKKINGTAHHEISSMEDLFDECDLENQDSSGRFRSSSFGRYLDIRTKPKIQDLVDMKSVQDNNVRGSGDSSPGDSPRQGDRRLLSRSLSLRTNTNNQADNGMKKYNIRKTLSVSPLIQRKDMPSPSQSPSNSSLESSPCGSRENLSSAMSSAGSRTAPKSRFFKPSYKPCEIKSSHRRCPGDQRYCDEMTVYYEKFDRDAAKIPNKPLHRSDSDNFDCKVKQCVRDFTS